MARLIETWDLPGLEHWKCRAVELLSEPKNAAAVRLIADWLVTNRRIDYELLELLVTLADGETTQEKFDWYLGIRAGCDPKFRKDIRKPSNK